MRAGRRLWPDASMRAGENLRPSKNELELQAHRQLDHPRATAHHARRCTDRGGRCATHRGRDFAETPAALTGHWICEVGVVKQIEEICQEAELEALAEERKVLADRKVVVCQARTVVLIASGGANASRRRYRREVGFIEGVVRGPVVLGQRASSNDVRPVFALIEPTEVVRAVKHREGRAGLKRGDSRNLPAAQDLTVD